jgi:hypothetical protein
MTITFRSVKGSALTYAEMDENIRDLDERIATVPTGITWEIKTANFNAIANYGYFVNTTLGTITATLPSSATLGDEITFIDGNGTFDTNNFTIARNGHKIQGLEEDLTVSVENAGFTLVYYNVEMGWKLKDK